MNDRDLRYKKTQYSAGSIHHHPHLKSGSAAVPPKQPPNISKHFQYEMTKKKEILYCQNKENKINREYKHETFQGSEGEKVKGRSIGLSKGSLQRASHGRLEDNKIKKSKKDTYHYSRHSKLKKNHHKEAREPRSTIEDDCSETFHKIKKTECLIDTHDQNKLFSNLKYGLICKQKLIKRIKKNMSPDLSETASNIFLSSQAITKTPAEEINEFEEQCERIHIEEETEAVSQIAQKEKNEYSLNYSDILRRQPNITWLRRGIIVNWMMEILAGYGSKRETFAVATYLFDKYLAIGEPIQVKEELQLIAGTAVYIANKLENHIFGAKQVCEAMGNYFTVDQILEQEIKLMVRLKWKLNPPTVNMWANRLSAQWDLYLEKHPPHYCELLNEHRAIIKFRSQDIDVNYFLTQGYNNFRELMQYIDFAILEIHSLQYHCREIAASFMYIILNCRIGLYSRQEIVAIFPNSSRYLLDGSEFNSYFDNFLFQSFGFHLQDLLPTIQFCATFLILPLCFKLPPAVDNEDQEEITFSDLCAFQVCNQSFVSSLRKRNRNID